MTLLLALRLLLLGIGLIACGALLLRAWGER